MAVQPPYTPEEQAEYDRALRQNDGFYDLILLPAVIIGWSWLSWRWWKERKLKEEQDLEQGPG